MAGHTVVVGQLLRALADPNQLAQDGRTALHRCAFQGWIPTARLLLDNGADPTIQDKEKDDTPLLLAQSRQMRELISSYDKEKVREASEVLKQRLASRPPPLVFEKTPPPTKPADDNKSCDASVAEIASTPTPVGGGGARGFCPPPRGPADKDKKTLTAQKEAKYQQALAELAEETARAADAFDEPCCALLQQRPLIARVQVQGAGEDRLNGVYKIGLAMKDRVEYQKLGDSQCQILWAEYQDEWRLFIADFKLGSTLYRHKYRPNVIADECHGVPLDGWTKWFGTGPVPTIRYLAEDEDVELPRNEQITAQDTADCGEDMSAIVSPGSVEPQDSPLSQHSDKKRSEFIELHSHLQIVPDEGEPRANLTGPLASRSQKKVEISLAGGDRIVETADGLFSAAEVPDVGDGQPADDAAVIPDMDFQAAAWLEHIDAGTEVPVSWDAVRAAKATAIDLFSEGKISDARKATTAGIAVARQLLQDGSHAEPEDTALLGTLYSNRSLLLLQQIQTRDEEVLAFGAEASWRLVAADASAALQADSRNFKASFRRARALFEVGDLEDALSDATAVVDHYAQKSAVPNPDAAELREQILAAVRQERSKWGQTTNSRSKWNRARHEVLISEQEKNDGEAGAEQKQFHILRGSSATESANQKRQTLANDGALAQRLAAAASRSVAAPKTGADVEKALLTTLKNDVVRRRAYVTEHLSPATVQRLFRKAPLGPDLLGELVVMLSNMPVEEDGVVKALVPVLGVTPSSQTHAAMFDSKERAALELLLTRCGPDAAAAWQA